MIVKAADRGARALKLHWVADVQRDSALLTTLVYLTEFPTVIRGGFDSSYLELPSEMLSTVMRHHQRYFSVLKPDGSLAPGFVAVTNTDGDPDGLIRQGNERVLRARFNDARFFWSVDQQKKLCRPRRRFGKGHVPGEARELLRQDTAGTGSGFAVGKTGGRR